MIDPDVPTYFVMIGSVLIPIGILVAMFSLYFALIMVVLGVICFFVSFYIHSIIWRPKPKEDDSR